MLDALGMKCPCVCVCVQAHQYEFPGCETLIAKIIFKLSIRRRYFIPDTHLICFYFSISSLGGGRQLQNRNYFTERREENSYSTTEAYLRSA